MHYVSQSATKSRGDTSRRISSCAQALADDRGLDGFTMDDLAEAAGVSRRTLFNYFSGKVDAVLGEWRPLDEADVARFRDGGPHGDLVADLRALLAPFIEAKFADRDELARSRRILLANPRLISTVHQRYEELCAVVVEQIVAREGVAFGAGRAKVAISLLAALFDASLDGYLADPREREFSHHFDETLLIARSLLGA
ncbi:hypothetical protein GCM10023340_18470 [Nocardioides marinquilinus]|uniref:HTH tetR-type domain-containing protein n=1 Tax=Nocardioides marinquilinus TaxID=1210400 RepID=A0ABP9PL43_9ACTN